MNTRKLQLSANKCSFTAEYIAECFCSVSADILKEPTRLETDDEYAVCLILWFIL